METELGTPKTFIQDDIITAMMKLRNINSKFVHYKNETIDVNFLKTMF